MGNRDDERSGRDRGQGANFDQQGQQVNGPQYNADRIYFRESVSPDAIAEGLRRYHEPPPKNGIDFAELQRQREEADLRDYGYRYYTRDRRQWLQSLPPRERWNERRREGDRVEQRRAISHHRRILRAGNLPPATSPADPRYVQAKKDIDRKEGKRELYLLAASIAFLLALALIAILDDAVWMAVILGIALVVGLVKGRRQSKRWA
ncbi:hypothetical protein [Nocardia sp. NBC_00416]|uniref:hypothetical protein n=1 Tax=Nocardia sp. NBC_00416 TaxID=2975991 RepID=UPI002E1BE8DE